MKLLLKRANYTNKTRQKGVALILVITVVALLTTMITQFIEDTSIYHAINEDYLSELQATYLARSAINLSRLFLVVQPYINNIMRSFRLPPIPLWKYMDYVLYAFNKPKEAMFIGYLLGTSLSDAKGLEEIEGKMSVKIVDEDSKINLNMASSPLLKELLARQLKALFAPAKYNKLFEELDIDGQYTDRDTYIQAIIDFIDEDNIPYGFNSGSEDELIYSQHNPPYKKKDAPLDSLEELRLVRGVGDDFWTAFVEPYPDEPEKRIITVWGQGKININTAPAIVLAAIICTFAKNPNEPACDPLNPEGVFLLAQFIEFMRDAGGMLPGLGSFNSVEDFLTLIKNGVEGMIPGVELNPTEAKRYLTVDSRVFSIYATGEVNKIKKEIHVVIDTRGEKATEGGAIIYWREF